MSRHYEDPLMKRARIDVEHMLDGKGFKASRTCKQWLVKERRRQIETELWTAGAYDGNMRRDVA